MNESCGGSKIQLFLKNSNKKLKQFFPNDPKANIVINFKNKSYKLSKAHLWIQSKYFQKEFASKNEVSITQNFDKTAFDQILSLFYGNEVRIQRSQVVKYSEIIGFLDIQYLRDLLRKDMLQNIIEYDIFITLKIAQINSDQELFQLCLQQLQKQEFSQIYCNQNQLMNLDIGLFKLVVKAHNKSKLDKRQPSQFRKIMDVIQIYCNIHELGQQKYEEMIFSMLDIPALNSKQFKEVFMKKQKEKPNVQSASKQSNKQSESSNHDSSFDISQYSQKFYLSKLLQKNVSIHKLKIDNIYLRKKVKQIQRQNSKLTEQLKKLLQQSIQQQQIQQQIQKNFRLINDSLLTQLETKQNEQNNQKKTLKGYATIIDSLQEQLNKKSEQIEKLHKYYTVQAASQKQKKKHKNKQAKPSYSTRQTKSEPNMIVTSQFLPASLIHQIMQSQSKQKQIVKPTSERTSQKLIRQQVQQEEQDEQQIQQKYMDRVAFSVQPISIQKKRIPTLSKLITDVGFGKKSLQLVFRRSAQYPDIGKKQNIYNRQQLLILIKVKTGQQIGCYIGSKIDSGKNSCSEDKSCYLLSLTHNKRFKIGPEQQPDKIYVTQKYLLSITSDCINNKSCFIWPEKKGNSSTNMNVQWFTGNSEFQIRHIEVYQIGQMEMEMII